MNTGSAMRKLFVPAGIALAAGSLAGRAAPPAGLTIEALIEIKHPSQAVWSPDGRRIAFVWDQGGVQNVWTVDAAGGEPTAVTRFDSAQIEGLTWAGGDTMLLARKGDLWRASGLSHPQRVWTTDAIESDIALSPDSSHAAFIRDGDLWTRVLVGGAERRLTQTPAVEANPVWSPDGARIAFTVSTVTRYEDAPAYSGTRILYTRFERTPSNVGVVSAAGGQAVMVASTPASETTPRWVDATRLVLQRLGNDFKSRDIVLTDVTTAQERVLHRDEDEKWWSLPGRHGAHPQPSPDGRWVAFLSDRDGWDHLYVVSVEGGDAIQLTRGSFEVCRPQWSPDSRWIAFDSNEGSNPGSRHLAIVEVGSRPAAASVVPLAAGRGTATDLVTCRRRDRLSAHRSRHGRTLGHRTAPEGDASPTDRLAAGLD
jgi:Tol biopolymer transport system component